MLLVCYNFYLEIPSAHIFSLVTLLGSIPEIDELFPPRPPSIKRAAPDEPQVRPVPMTTGVGFFTPDTGNTGHVFRGWKAEPAAPQAFRMALPLGPRDSM